MEDFEVKVDLFWKKVQEQYSALIQKGGIAENRDYYVFQTGYHHEPDLMIVGINPGGDGMSGASWLCPDKNENMYLTGEHKWFQTLRDIFGYPHNEKLKPYLDNCVGSNRVFLNTGNQDKIPQSDLDTLGPKLIRELVYDIIQPKHIITLGNDVFYALRTGKENSRKFGEQNLKYGLAKGTHICYIPNPSARNVRFFNSESKLKDWEQALEWFLSL